MSFCFALWCLGADVRPNDIRLMTTQDVFHNAGVDNRLVAVSGHWIIGGYVYQPDSRDVAFVGAVPLRIQFHPRVVFEAGGVVATGELPHRGTLANWLARVQVRLTDVFAFEVVHLSNGGPRDIVNPALDSIGMSIRLK
ncbi:MAG TPA: hypothetical protein VJ691_10165 [Vicinamibacterales bacterium]|nr:hypothetical protein [Vicinamibacterales bacterium]